jgi:opacity protein-like surface antigen
MSLKLKSPVAAAVAVSMALAGPLAFAGDGPVRLLVNGGFAPTVGDTANYLKAGWNLGLGLQIQPDTAGQLAMQLDLNYTNFNGTQQLVQLGQGHSSFINSGRGDVWSLTADGKYMTDSEPVRGYALLGVGAYHRYVELSQTAYGLGYVCDPWWGWCYPSTVEGTVIRASRANTKIGFNAGIGVEFLLENDSSWFIEARYHWIDGGHPTEYIPIQIGFKF